MADVLELAERLWRGEISTSEFHPVGQAKRDVYSALAQASTSTMASGAFRWAAAGALDGAS